MLEFIRRNRIVLTSGLLLLFSLLLVSFSARTPQHRDPLAALLLEAMRPLQVIASDTSRTVEGVWDHYIALVGVRAENERLRRRVRELEQGAAHQAELETANRRLSALLDLRATLARQTVAARVSGRDPAAMFQSLTIDRGHRDGLRKGAAVVSPEGLVGQIVTVSEHAARVLLITDHNSGVDAIVERSQARGIVAGALADGCLMKYLQRGEDVVEGDRVVTSGLDGIFPRGIAVGEVAQVTRNNRGLLQLAEIQPAVPLDELEEVLVVLPDGPPPEAGEAHAGAS